MMTSDTAREYHSQHRLSKSSMDDLIRCPAKFKYTFDHMGEEHKESPALPFGSLFHSMILEPEKTEHEYRKKLYSGTTKAGKEEAAQAKADGVTLVPSATWEMCEGMTASANATWLLSKAKASLDWQTETSVYWDERDRIPCKARVDAIASIYGDLVAIDLKSTIDASPDAIARHIADYGYHRQAAWYTHALRLEGLDVRSFIFLFVEKEPPYVATAVTLAESALGAATDEIRTALDLYERCTESGVWPGYTSQAIETIDMPRWYYH